ncbi:MAG: hypothetical protein LW862_17820 [Rubrivivax sp.]|jgi:hypothetical protein|nr:hypothetical protein [Rubrivivax sp.]
MDINLQMAKARRETIRWLLLVALNVARPVGMSLAAIRSVVSATYADATDLELKRELDYLADRDLVTIQRDPLGAWHAELTRAGVDVAEYTVPVEPGILRPQVG